MDPVVTGALIQGGTGLLGGIMGSSAQSRANRAMIQNAREQRAWEERMSNTSWQRGVQDMLAAGMNPMLSFQQGGASTPSTTAANVIPEDAMGKAVTSAGGALASGIAYSQGLANIKKTLAEAESAQADARVKSAEAPHRASNAEAAVNQQMYLVKEQINSYIEQQGLTGAQRKTAEQLLESLTRAARADATLKESQIPSAKAGAEFWESMDTKKDDINSKDNWLQDILEWLFKARNAAK